MAGCGSGILEKTQRDPAGGEVALDLEILLVGHRRLARDAVGGAGVAGFQELARDQPALHPPFVGIDKRFGVAGRREQELGGAGVIILAAKQPDARKDIARLIAQRRRHRIEQLASVGGVADYRGAGLAVGGKFGAAALGRAQAGLVLLLVEKAVGAGFVIGACKHAGEFLQRLRLDVLGKIVPLPGLPHQGVGATLVARAE